jgi:hypothetical protein
MDINPDVCAADALDAAFWILAHRSTETMTGTG